MDAVRPEAGRGDHRDDHEGAAVGDLADERVGPDVRAPRHGLAHHRRRGRGVLPAYRGGRAVPVPGRRPRDHGHAGPVHGRAARALGPGALVDHGHQGAVRERAAGARSASGARPGTLRLQDAVTSRSVVVSGRSTWDHLPDMRMLPFTFRALEELEFGPAWQAVFEEKWPHYKTWFLREGEAARPSYATSVRMLRAHMPELVPAYERVVELAGGGDLAARMLSLYKPPPYLAACSQGVWTRDGAPLLVRNYDYAPSRFEGVVWSTNLRKRVIGMSDCLWGLLDGMK